MRIALLLLLVTLLGCGATAPGIDVAGEIERSKAEMISMAGVIAKQEAVDATREVKAETEWLRDRTAAVNDMAYAALKTARERPKILKKVVERVVPAKGKDYTKDIASLGREVRRLKEDKYRLEKLISLGQTSFRAYKEAQNLRQRRQERAANAETPLHQEPAAQSGFVTVLVLGLYALVRKGIDFVTQKEL